MLPRAPKQFELVEIRGKSSRGQRRGGAALVTRCVIGQTYKCLCFIGWRLQWAEFY